MIFTTNKKIIMYTFTNGDIWSIYIMSLLISLGLAILFQTEIDIPLKTLVTRYKNDKKTFVALAKDPAVLAFDAHKTVIARHPRHDHVKQTFLRSIDHEIHSVATPYMKRTHAQRLHKFKQTGEIKAIDVHGRPRNMKLI